MPRNNELAATVFGDNDKLKTPEWKRIQEEKAARCKVMLEKQKAARLARDAAIASSDNDRDRQPKTRSQNRKPRRSLT